MPAGRTARPALRPVEDVEAETAATSTAPRVDWRDGLAVIGLALLVVGVAQIYVPASLIVLGVALLLAASRA